MYVINYFRCYTFLTFLYFFICIYQFAEDQLFTSGLMIISSMGKVILLFLLHLDVLSRIFGSLALRNNYEPYYLFCSFLLILSCAVSIFNEALISMKKFFD
jgi:hypothetical protein